MNKSAGVLLIGDELLSGRTQDSNLVQIANFLGAIGIQLAEARVIGDLEAEIIQAVRDLAKRYDVVLTTGGIGPTHDDITAAAIAKAFNRACHRNPDAVKAIAARFALNRPGEPPGEARLRMADMPEGAELIDNPVSGAPGFRIENVFVLAGVPLICAAMLDSLINRIEGGERWLSHTLKAKLAEGDMAEALGNIQKARPNVKIGSYPSFGPDGAMVRIVARAPESAAQTLQSTIAQLRELITALGAKPIDE